MQMISSIGEVISLLKEESSEQTQPAPGKDPIEVDMMVSCATPKTTDVDALAMMRLNIQTWYGQLTEQMECHLSRLDHLVKGTKEFHSFV